MLLDQKHFFFKFSPEIACQLQEVEFLEGKCLADCVCLLQLTLGATIFYLSSFEKKKFFLIVLTLLSPLHGKAQK